MKDSPDQEEKSTLIHDFEISGQEDQVKEKKKHWFWGNWIVLGLSAALVFTVRSLVMGEMSQQGYEGLYYLATGEILPGVIVFIYKKEWKRRNCLADKDDQKKKKVLMRTWDNKFDWWTSFVIFIGVCG